MSNNASVEGYANGSNLKEVICRLHEKKEFADVTFTVGSKEFKAHKLILASRCNEFARILYDPNAIPDIVIEDKSITETGFEILLRFIYTDELGTDDKKSIVEAYLAAVHYKQKKLIEKCERLMQIWSITLGEVCELLNISLGITTLEENCLDFIKRNALDVISSPTFFKLNYGAIAAVLEKDALKDVQIKERLEKIIEWGRKQQKNPDDFVAVRNYFLKNSPPLLGKLKIEELSYDELNELLVNKYEGFLNSDEVMKIMRYFHKKDRAVLPEWFHKP